MATLGVTRVDKIRHEYIRGTAQVERSGQKVEMVWKCAEEISLLY